MNTHVMNPPEVSSSNQATTSGLNDDQDPLEPQLRMKRLIESSHNISVDKNISISKYFHSGRELIKSAGQHESKSEIEKAFVLYLRFMTLNLEKLPNHPGYKDADKAEKKLVKDECKRVFDVAEDLKKRILEKYKAEFQAANQQTKQSN